MTVSRRTLLGGIGLGLVGSAGCTAAPDGGGEDPFAVESTAFEEDEPIPADFTCDGSDVSPPLSFENVPSGAAALGLIVDDPDAPSGTFTHWLVWNVPADTTSLPRGVPTDGTVDSLGGARQGTNDFGAVGYRGPCPPAGDPPHTYRFTGYALSGTVDVAAGAKRDAVEGALDDAAIDTVTLTGTYDR